MREVLKWNKNYLTGELKTLAVEKPNNGLQGKVNIKLYKDGILINETFTENIIVNHFNMAETYRALFHSIANGSTSLYGGLGQPGAFRNIILGTNDREEAQENIKGDCGVIIGWCPKTNTNPAADITRGSYNPTESFSEWDNGYYHAHLVYDFGTSQGNGTFNSAWWSRAVKNSSDTGGVILPEYCVEFTKPIGGGRSRVISNSEYMYTGAFGKYFKYNSNTKKYHLIINGEAFAQGLENFKLSNEEKYCFQSLNEMPLFMNEINKEKVVVAKNLNFDSNGNNYECTFDLVVLNREFNQESSVTLNLKNFKGITDVMNRSVSYPHKKIWLNRIFKVLENGDVYMSFSAQSGYEYGRIFPSYNKDTDMITDNQNVSTNIMAIYNVFTNVWTLEPKFLDVNNLRFSVCTTWNNVLGYVEANGKRYYYRNDFQTPIMTIEESKKDYLWDIVAPNINDLQPKQLNPSYGNAYGWATAHIHDTTYIITSSANDSNSENYYGGDMRIIHGYAAHTKLPNPVTKTSADTMKIQYDYYIQVPKIVSTNGDYLTYPE